MKRILLTGAAGFIGFHLTQHLCKSNYHIIGIDNLNDYYDVNLKLNRLKLLKEVQNFKFVKCDMSNYLDLQNIFESEKFDLIIHLAAQAGVRYSLINPTAYIKSNIDGFVNLLECSQKSGINDILYASSSSVYGLNSKVPFSEDDRADQPVSLYAATKKSNELIAHTYSSLYNLSLVGLRFFTVYGPWGRPDMAYFQFTKSILSGEPIKVFNNGNLERDFTFIDDIVSGIESLLNVPQEQIFSELNSSNVKHTVFNIGNNKPEKLMNFISILESLLNKKAKLEFLEMQKGDVYKTYADISKLKKISGFNPKTNLEEGLKIFTDWYVQYFQ
jgi:UDP-glucuronate 4-epimerase